MPLLRKIFLPVIAVLLIAAGIVIQRNAYNIATADYNLAPFRKVFTEKEKEADQLLTFLEKRLRMVSFSEFTRQCTDSLTNLAETHGIAAYVFNNDSLVFWSDNILRINHQFPVNDFNGDVIKLWHHWVYVKKTTADNYTLVAVIVLKSDYEYSNDFLENAFFADFGLPPTFNISTSPGPPAMNINSEHNKFLFSLIPGEKTITNATASYFGGIAYLAGYLLLVVFLILLANRFFKKRFYAFLSGLFIIVVSRFLMINFHFPELVHSLDLFSPVNYAASAILPSLGDLLINSILLLILILFCHRTSVLSLPERQNAAPVLKLIFSGIVISMFFFLVHYLLYSLVYYSNIPLEVFKVLTISGYSILAFIVIGILFFSFFIFCDLLFRLFPGQTISLKLVFCFMASIAAVSGTLLLAGYPADLLSIAALFIFVLVFYYLRTQKKFRNHYFPLIIIVFLVSIYSSLFVISNNGKKESEKRKILVAGLANERDPVAEMLLSDFQNQLLADTVIQTRIENFPLTKDAIYQHILSNYFHGFWSKYDLQLTICNRQTDLIIEPDKQVCNCFNYFGDFARKFGTPIPGSSFYFLDNVNGRISYLGSVKYSRVSDTLAPTLYLELFSKLVSRELGYPELLLDKKLYEKTVLDDYSYAKYRNHVLIAKSGEFAYSLSDKTFGKSNNEMSFCNISDYSHLVYRFDKATKIVISTPLIGAIEILISFSYIFLFFFTLVTLFYLSQNLTLNFRKLRLNFKNRIQFAMIAVLLLSSLMIGGGSVYYIIKQYEQKQNETVAEKLQSVLIELSDKFGNEKNIASVSQEELTRVLIKWSNVFYSDINLFDLQGNLVASSRPEIFKKHLMSSMMNPDAFLQLKYNSLPTYLHNERIGKLNYLSAYTPFSNMNNERLGFLNLPYFTKEEILNKEISTLVVAMVNIYVLLFLFATLIGVFISDRVTQPLRLLQKKFREIQLGRKNQKIIYDREDEIGELVKEYNLMLDELSRNVELLSRSERETAWREMAKQIAHEIKNPLTPMKLNVQHLQRAYRAGQPESEKQIEKVTLALIEQIDALSAIASEFSNFAKMPQPVNEVIDLTEKISSAVQLFEKSEKVKIITNYNKSRPVHIFADKEQVLRVFNNLLKNACQAIPAEMDGIITIDLIATSEKALVKIQDNGIGIPEELREKLFIPNFTTKSSGMGLGLAISKNVVLEAGGDIWFETETGKGSTFYIEFPLNKKPQA